MDNKKKCLFIFMMTVLTVVALAVLISLGELIIRYRKAKGIDSRISTLEKLVRSNAVFNKGLFEGFDNREDEVKIFFEEYSKIPIIYRPYIIWRRAPNFKSKPININSLGYRGGEFAIKKPPDVFRILIYGGSVVWGTGALSDAETIPAHLEKYLNQKLPQGKRFEVINCGETSFHTTQEAVFLLIEGVYLSPDLVVFVDGQNDPVMPDENYPAGYPWYFEVLKKRLSKKKAEVFTLEGELDYLRKQREVVWKTNYSELLNTLDKRVSIEQKRILESKWLQNQTTPEEYALRHFYNIRCAQGMAKEFGFRAAFAIQPLPICFKPLHPEEKQALDTLKKQSSTHYKLITWREKYYVGYTDQVVALCKKNETPILDLKKIFENNSEPIYFDDCHMTGDGYRLVAQQLGQWLIEEGLVSVEE